MKRFFYGFLIWLHPPAFRQRFGDEMLYIFDETADAGTARLFADGLLSLVWQWVVRSGAWKLALGTAMSGLLLGTWAAGLAYSQRVMLNRRVTPYVFPSIPTTPLDRAAFTRSAAQAVAMLAQFQKDDERKRWVARHPIHNPAENPSPETHTNRD
jgi:hypothetical protein